MAQRTSRAQPSDVMASFLAERAAAERARLDELRASVQKALPELAQVLFDAGASQVWVFGSVVEGGFHLRSDIDLAVEGLPPERYFHVLSSLHQRAPVPVDLVELEQASSSLRDHIAAHGRLLVSQESP